MYDVFIIMYDNLFKHKGLSLERLHSFCLVASARGYNKAAGENAYKQSQYSKQILDLEKFFGCRLIIRGRGSFCLTDAGKRLLDLSKSFFSQVELFADTACSAKIDLSISAGQSVIDYVIPRILTKEVFTHAGAITLKERNSQDAIHNVLSYDATLAIATDSAAANKDLRSFRILSSKTVMIFKKDAAGFYVGDDLKQLAGNPTVVLTGTGRYKRAIEKIFVKPKLNITVAVPSLSSLKAYAHKGTVVTYIPEYCLTDADRQALTIHTFSRLSSIRRELYLICRKNLLESSGALREIIKTMTERPVSRDL